MFSGKGTPAYNFEFSTRRSIIDFVHIWDVCGSDPTMSLAGAVVHSSQLQNIILGHHCSLANGIQMIAVRIVSVEAVTCFLHNDGWFSSFRIRKLPVVHNWHNIIVQAGVSIWILRKLAVHVALDIVPLNLHIGIAIRSRLLMGHSHAMKHLVNGSAAIVATGDLQVQLLISWIFWTKLDLKREGCSCISMSCLHINVPWNGICSQNTKWSSNMFKPHFGILCLTFKVPHGMHLSSPSSSKKFACQCLTNSPCHLSTTVAILSDDFLLWTTRWNHPMMRRWVLKSPSKKSAKVTGLNENRWMSGASITTKIANIRKSNAREFGTNLGLSHEGSPKKK